MSSTDWEQALDRSETTPAPSDLDNLPTELLLDIVSRLEWIDAAHLGATAHRFYTKIRPDLWRHIDLRLFPSTHVFELGYDVSGRPTGWPRFVKESYLPDLAEEILARSPQLRTLKSASVAAAGLSALVPKECYTLVRKLSALIEPDLAECMGILLSRLAPTLEDLDLNASTPGSHLRFGDWQEADLRADLLDSVDRLNALRTLSIPLASGWKGTIIDILPKCPSLQDLTFIRITLPDWSPKAGDITSATLPEGWASSIAPIRRLRVEDAIEEVEDILRTLIEKESLKSVPVFTTCERNRSEPWYKGLLATLSERRDAGNLEYTADAANDDSDA